MIGWYYYPGFWAFALPGFLLALWASFYTRSTFARYSRVPCSSRLTGAQAAARMLAAEGVRDVSIEQTGGLLSDHYNPLTRTLRLSRDVYGSASLAAIGVACHEAGHALQHADRYAMLGLRSALVPAANIGSNLAYVFLLLGSVMRSSGLILVGAGVFFFALLFALVTLPVEWNASARAKTAMVAAGIVSAQEQRQASAVLNAAFLTYVAAAVSAALTLLYFLVRAGVFRRND